MAEHLREGDGRLTPARRAALVAATVAEFARVGYQAASLNRIIRDAGMSKSSFYHFVGSKQELFDTVVRILIDDVTAHWSPPRAEDFAGERFWSVVDAVLADFADLARSASLQHLGRIFYLPADGADRDARADLLDRVRGWVDAVLRVGRASGQVRGDLPVDLQSAVAFAVLRAVDEWAVGAAGGGDPLVDEGRARAAAAVPGTLLRRLLAP